MPHENTGHRNRLRERMVKEGLQSFQDHEVLELLLFQYLPRHDTNKIAHNLINKFGSLANVLDASVNQLVTVDGVSFVTACNLTMLKDVWSRYQASKTARQPLTSIGEIVDLGRELITNNTSEELIFAFVDAGTNYVGSIVTTSNSKKYVAVEIKKVVTSAMEFGASGVIIFHNHGSAPCVPSQQDIELTKTVFTALANFDVVIIDHVIFNEKLDYFSFFMAGLMDDITQQLTNK